MKIEMTWKQLPGREDWGFTDIWSERISQARLNKFLIKYSSYKVWEDTQNGWKKNSLRLGIDRWRLSCRKRFGSKFLGIKVLVKENRRVEGAVLSGNEGRIKWNYIHAVLSWVYLQWTKNKTWFGPKTIYKMKTKVL